ncbi:uncharacterized protein LOC143195616 [Rhynchophorus ferrugineus]|uniref:uncharacterized protein LOC143195616 n=1 Tax=Rhynchophorus ferrugineus TaxID=354439 RepID=UPI003FCC9E88
MLGLLKFFGFATLIYKKICLLLKFFHAALQFKFFLLALAGFLLHLAKLWHSFKHEHHPTKVIYYEHAQHQHHYGHGEEDGHSIWARALHMDNSTAQKSAYAAQKPIVLITVTDKVI